MFIKFIKIERMRIIDKIFNRKNELDTLMINFLKNENISSLMKEQAITVQKESFRLRDIERRTQIEERYSYLQKMKDERVLTEKEEQDYDFFKYLIKDKWIIK